MLVPVGILAVLSTIGGLVSIPGVWHPFTHWVEDTGELIVGAQAFPKLERAGNADVHVASVAFPEDGLTVAGLMAAWNKAGRTVRT